MDSIAVKFKNNGDVRRSRIDPDGGFAAVASARRTRAAKINVATRSDTGTASNAASDL